HADHLLVDRRGGHLAGELTRGGAAHPVGDDEQRPALSHVVLAYGGQQGRFAVRQIRHQEVVLVVVPHLAEIGLGEDLDADGLGGASEHGQPWHPVTKTSRYLRTVGARFTAVLTQRHPSNNSFLCKNVLPMTNAAYALSSMLTSAL